MASKPKSKDQQSDEISILEISTGVVQFAILGESPLIFNRMSEKAKRELLLPRGRLTAAAKAVNVKHDPIQEYRDSVYRNAGPDPATRLKLPAPSFKGALCTAALDIPGARKTEIGRLVWIPGTHIDIYGVPQLFMGVVRSADIAKTPDIRTRAILAQWACVVTVRFVQPKLTGRAIANLMAAAGIISGVGDFRQEKGKGNYGQFRCVESDDEELLRVIESGGRQAQDEALHHFTCYDEDSEELLQWYEKEIKNRGRSNVVTLREDDVKDAAD